MIKEDHDFVPQSHSTPPGECPSYLPLGKQEDKSTWYSQKVWTWFLLLLFYIIIFFFSDLQSLWNLLVTRIYYICYSTCFYSWETALFRKRGRETFLLWNFRDCCEWHTYTSGVSIGSAQTKGCHSGRAVSFMKDAATCWTFPLMITKKWGASCYCFCSCYVEEDVVM